MTTPVVHTDPYAAAEEVGSKAQAAALSAIRNVILARDEQNNRLHKQLRKKQSELDLAERQMKDATAREKSVKNRLAVIITQAGFPTRMFCVLEQEPLSQALERYAGLSGQSAEDFIVFLNQPGEQNIMVTPSTRILEPKAMENGTYHYEAFEVKKIVSADTSTKRKALASASGQAVKKQKG